MRPTVLALVLLLVSAVPAAANSLVYVKDSNVWAARPDGTGAVPERLVQWSPVGQARDESGRTRSTGLPGARSAEST